MNAVRVAAQQWFDYPGRQRGHEPQGRPQDYTKAREVILRITESRSLEPADFSKGIDSYRSLHWVFRSFEDLAVQCTQVIRVAGPSLIELGALTWAILEMEARITSEEKVWAEFRIRANDEGNKLPYPANYNVLHLARQAVRLVEILEDEEHYRRSRS